MGEFGQCRCESRIRLGVADEHLYTYLRVSEMTIRSPLVFGMRPPHYARYVEVFTTGPEMCKTHSTEPTILPAMDWIRYGRDRLFPLLRGLS
jgi:hypothetical protein